MFKQQFFSLFFLAAVFGHRLNFDSGMDKLPSRAAILKRNLPVAIFPSSFPMSLIDLIVQLSVVKAVMLLALKTPNVIGAFRSLYCHS